MTVDPTEYQRYKVYLDTLVPNKQNELKLPSTFSTSISDFVEELKRFEQKDNRNILSLSDFFFFFFFSFLVFPTPKVFLFVILLEFGNF